MIRQLDVVCIANKLAFQSPILHAFPYHTVPFVGQAKMAEGWFLNKAITSPAAAADGESGIFCVLLLVTYS